jgi:hypothetical protein
VFSSTAVSRTASAEQASQLSFDSFLLLLDIKKPSLANLNITYYKQFFGFGRPASFATILAGLWGNNFIKYIL